MPALAVWTPEDGLLGALAPLGLAAACPGPVLVIDLDDGGPQYLGEQSLADLVADGPRLDDLRPPVKLPGVAGDHWCIYATIPIVAWVPRSHLFVCR